MKFTKALFVLLLLILVSTNVFAWYNNDWGYRQELSLNTSNLGLSGDITNDHVILVDINSDNTAFWGRVDSNFNDVLFVAADDTTPLNFHAEEANYAGESFIAWVEVTDTFASATNETIYLYYDADGKTHAGNEAGTYPSTYKAVYHLNEASGTRYDSTSNNNDLTTTTWVDSVGVGKIGPSAPTGSGVKGAGDGDLKMSANSDDFEDLSFSILTWVKHSGGAVGDNAYLETLWCFAASDKGYVFSTDYGSQTLKLEASMQNSSYSFVGETIDALSADTWTLAVLTYDTSDDDAFIYFNDVLKASNTSIAEPSFANNPTLSLVNDFYAWNGTKDETKFINYRLSQDEITLLYNSENENLITFGAEEAGAGVYASFDYNINKYLTKIDFNSTSTAVATTINSYSWLINGVEQSTDENFSYTTTQLQDINACLYVADAGEVNTNQVCTQFNTGDWEAPTTFATAAQIANYSTANINITCTDNNSACDRVYYKINSGAWTDTNSLPIDVNYNVIGTHTLQWYATDLAGNIEDTNSLNFTITGDTTPPTITFSTSIVDVGFVNDFNVGLTLYCADNRLDDLNYIIQKTANGTTTTLLNVQDSNAQTKYYWDNLSVGANQYTGKCIDYNGNSVQQDSNIIYAMNFRLINEETGAALTDLNAVDVDALKAYTYDGNNVYDYNIYAPATKYFIDYDNVVRFDLTYNDVSETKLSREIDFGLLPDANVGICIAPFQSFYGQFLVSSIEKDVIVFNDFAECYNLASTTKFAYENALMVRAFTINKPYYLYTWIDDIKTLLATIDGSKATVINLDVLEFNKETYTFEIATDTVVFKCLEDPTTGICDQNTISIYYKSLREDNATTNLKIYHNNTLLWQYTEEDEPNEFNTNWFYGDDDLNANTVLKLTITKTSEAGASTSSDYWFDLQGQSYSGTMDASLALIFSFMLLFVGLTLVAYRYAMGWFGIALCVIAVGILSFAPGFWYIQFMQAIMVIVAVFIAIVFSNETRGVN